MKNKMEKQQTAIEWLMEQFFSTKRESSVEEIIEQAKAMEKEQIIKAREALYHGTPEQYYNETFKSE